MVKSSGKSQTSFTLLREKRERTKEELSLQGKTEQQRGLDEMVKDIKSKGDLRAGGTCSLQWHLVSEA